MRCSLRKVTLALGTFILLFLTYKGFWVMLASSITSITSSQSKWLDNDRSSIQPKRGGDNFRQQPIEVKSDFSGLKKKMDEGRDKARQQPMEIESNFSKSRTKQAQPDSYESFKRTKPKLILAYTSLYGQPFGIQRARTPEEVGKVPDPLAACEYRCDWSTDTADYNRSDAVVFHLYNLSPKAKGKGYGEFVISNLPTRYSTDQKWVLMIREPGSFFYPQQLKLLDDKFNLTMTFQSDSDVIIPYGSYWKLSPQEANQRTKSRYALPRPKRRLIAWLASNCVTSSKREEYVKEMQKNIKIDAYGSCGTGRTRERYSTAFRKKLAKTYSFYIAFENSDCDDYITEKFWESLDLGMIPVVKGQRSNYAKAAPPNSYIHADLFQSPRELAQHIENVSTNLTLFQEYHKWRRTYEAKFQFITINRWWMCDLCKQVHVSPRKTVNVYNHFSEDTRCNVNDRNRDRRLEHMEDLELGSHLTKQ